MGVFVWSAVLKSPWSIWLVVGILRVGCAALSTCGRMVKVLELLAVAITTTLGGAGGQGCAGVGTDGHLPAAPVGRWPWCAPGRPIGPARSGTMAVVLQALAIIARGVQR